MRIAYKLGSNNKNPLRGLALLIVLLLIAPLTSLSAEEPTGPAEVSAANVEVADGNLIIDLGLSRPAGVRTFTLTSPDRLVFDIENTVLAVPEDTVTRWTNPLDGISMLILDQFSLEPPVVRIVAEVSNSGWQTDRLSEAGSLKLAIFRGQSPLSGDGPGAPPENLTPTIERFWHEPVDDGHDRFVIDFSFGVVLPQIRIESPTVILLRFPGSDILLPASAPANFATSVSGNVVSLMRAERFVTSETTSSEIRLTVPDTQRLGYTLETTSDDTLEFLIFLEEPVTPVPEPVLVDEPGPTPVEIEGGQIMVLASGEDVPVLPDARIKVNRVQFQAIDRNTDRFYIFYEGGVLEPRVQRFNYPTRIALYFPDTAVVLPESAEGMFDSVVNGVVAGELKVVNRVIEDVGPECQFMFYFPDTPQENVAFTIDYIDTGVVHVDFYQASGPQDIDNPVEVNTSMDEGIPEPEISTEPAPVPVIEEPEIIEEPEVIEEPVVMETPEPGPPMLTVGTGEAVGNIVNFVITSTGPLTDPEWVQYRYPNRIGLRFPLSDVQILDADPGVYTAYTHINLMPIVRAIIKDRPDDQCTTITFALEGDLEEFTGDYTIDGNQIRVSFVYEPIPELEAPVVVPEVPEIEEPVIVEPEVPVVEEEPVVAEPVPAPEPEQVVQEPVIEETEAESAGAPAPPGVPPFESPALLPVIELTIGEVTDQLVIFHIKTSEPLPMPEWVEYRYPDRMGLKFPLVDAVLLGNPEVPIIQTHITTIPMVREVVKDQVDEQYTTLAFTLGGSLDEFDGDINWNGCEMDVAFHYSPLVPELAIDTTPEPPVVVEVEVEAMPEEPVEESEPEPVAITEPAVIEEETVETSFEIAEVEVEAETAEVEQEEEIEEAVGPTVIEPEPEEEDVRIAFFNEEEVANTDYPVVRMAENEALGDPEVMVTEDDLGWGKDFEGVLITDVSFETIGDADVLRFTTDGYIDDWEVQPVNFPTKFLVRLPDSRPVLPNGNIVRYDERVNGSQVDQYIANATVSLDVSYTILTVYAHGVEATNLLDHAVDISENEWAIAIFPAGSSSPFVNAGPPGPSVHISEGRVEGEPGMPEPRPVTEILGEDIGEEVVDLEGLDDRGPRMSMRLEEANIRDVLQLIAEQAGLNISIGPSVHGAVTINLTDIQLFDLLDLLGAQLNFTYYVQHGVYIFGESAALKSQFSDFWPRWYIALSYADPDQIRSILTSLQILGSDQIQIYRGTAGGASVAIASPVMIMNGEETDLRRAYQIIAAVDQPPVMIQVDFQILNTSITDNQNLGFQFNFGTGSGTTNLYFSEQVSLDPDMGPFTQGFDRLRQGTANVYSINYVINYLVEEGYAELMNRSSLTVANNQQGQLFVGENIPYRSTYQVSELGRVTQRVAVQAVGLQLNFRAHANPDGTVTMYLTPVNSNLLELTDIGPRTVDQRFATTVRVNDGEPFIIGGFIKEEKRVNYDRFPFLSELPLLGHLFRNQEVRNTRSELIFVFTPHIIRPSRHLPEIWTDRDFEVPLNLGSGPVY